MDLYDVKVELEQLKKKMAGYAKILLAFLPITFLVCALMLIGRSKGIGIYLLFIPYMLVGSLFIKFAYLPLMETQKRFKEVYKDAFVVGTLQDCLDDVNYCWRGGFTPQFIEKVGLVGNSSRCESEDYLEAEYKGVRFEQSDVFLSHDKNTCFKGRMMIFHLPVKQVKDVRVFSKNFSHRAVLPDGLEKVEMEEMEFNQVFDVYSGDKHEAFYLLTPPMMERIKKMKRHNGNIAMRVDRCAVYVAYNTYNDSFDSNRFYSYNAPISLDEEEKKIRQDIEDVCEMIHVLGLFEQEERS